MKTVEEQYRAVIQKIESLQKAPSIKVEVICVSKGQPIEKILRLYQLGVRDFGENRITEALEKKWILPADIRWHLIGTLQSNKVAKAIGNFTLIHSIDSLELAKKISKVASERSLKQPVLLQVNISQEKTKHGLLEEEVIKQFSQFLNMPHLEIRGLMTMAPAYMTYSIEEQMQVRNVFYRLASLHQKLLQNHPQGASFFTELSMGMSQDFDIAIEEGSTYVRIGTTIFSGS